MNPISLNPISILLGLGKELIGLIPDGNKRAELTQQLQNAEVEMAKAQMEVNKVEAASDNFFKSGWRPATGWVGVAGLVWYVVAPSMGLPTAGTDVLVSILAGLLGLGGFRTLEKLKK